MPVPYKLTLLLRCHPDILPEAFTEHWLAARTGEPLAAADVARYAFGAPWRGDPPIPGLSPAPYDGLLETWWTRKSDAAHWVASPQFRTWLGQRMPVLAGRPEAVGGQPKVLWERGTSSEPEGAVTLVLLPTARRNITVQDFQTYWCGAHARLFLAGPWTTSRLHGLEATPAQTPPSQFVSSRFDGLAVATFESAEALGAELRSEHYRTRVAPAWRAVTVPDRTHGFAVTRPLRH